MGRAEAEGGTVDGRRGGRLRRRRGAALRPGRSPATVARVLAPFVSLLIAPAACGVSTEAPEPVTLRVVMTDDWATTPTVLAAVRDFEAVRPGVRVRVEGAPVREVTALVRAQVRAGDPPDVVQGHAFAAGAEGLAQPLDDLWERHLDLAAFLPGAVEDVTWAGRRFGIPLDTNAMVIVYDRQRLAASTAGDPAGWRTFGDLERAAAALTAPDGSHRALAFPFNTWQAYGWIRANGGEVIEVAPDGSVRLTLDAPAVVEAVGFLARLVQAGSAFPSVRTDLFADARALFRAGRASVLPSGAWDLPVTDPGRYGAAPLPGGTTGATRGTALGGSSLWVPQGSPRREVAFAFMRHLTSDGYALRAAKDEGRLPARTSVFADPWFRRPELAVVVRELQVASAFKLIALPHASSLFGRAVDDALRGRRPAAEALASAQRQAEAALQARTEPPPPPSGG